MRTIVKAPNGDLFRVVRDSVDKMQGLSCDLCCFHLRDFGCFRPWAMTPCREFEGGVYEAWYEVERAPRFLEALLNLRSDLNTPLGERKGTTQKGGDK